MNKYRAFSILLIIILSQKLYATNGMNMIGYGTRSTAMGGAVESVSNNNESMMINPAGLANLTAPEYSITVSLMDPDVSHSDNFGNSEKESTQRPPIPLFSISRPMGDWATGIGMFMQGGTGARYNDLLTPFSVRKAAGMLPDPMNNIPSSDSVKSRLMHLRITPTIARAVTDNFRLGATVNISHARAHMSMFPDTSVAVDGDGSGTIGDAPTDLIFNGLDIDKLSANGVSISLGFQYQINNWHIGGSYTSETKLNFKDGDADINMSAMGLGKVSYDAELDGLSWPEELALGVGYQIKPWLLLTTDLAWINWSKAVDTININIYNPDNLHASENNNIEMRMDWQDQLVWKIGMEVTRSDEWTLRMGYNHADAPVDNDYLRPIFPVVSETHYTLGATRHYQDWDLGLSFEYVPKIKKTNNNTDNSANLFGVGSSESLSQRILNLSFTRKF